MGDQKEICILIAASQPATRNALKLLLEVESDIFMISQAQDSHELLKKIESTHPDIIVLDWDLLDRATPVLIKTIATLDQKSAVIVLSAEADHKRVTLESGADAFVNIGDPPKELLVTINSMLNLSA